MDANIEQKIRYIAQLGREQYRDIGLKWAIDSRDRFLSDWYYALGFFLGHVFFRSRHWRVSQMFLDRAWGCLHALLGYSPDATPPATLHAALHRLKDEGWLEPSSRSDPSNMINQKLASAGVNHFGDRGLVIDSLALAVSLPQGNTVAWTVHEIEQGRLGAVDARIQSVYYVGPMTGAFFLRDTVSVFELEDHVAEKDRVRLQPLGRWVRKTGEEMGLFSEDLSDEQASQVIVTVCSQAGVSFIDFNQGAFHVGIHSLLKSDPFLAL